MSGKYVQVTESDIDDLIESSKRKGAKVDRESDDKDSEIYRPNVELHYDWAVKGKPDIYVRWWTSVIRGKGRDCGKDAMRVCIVSDTKVRFTLKRVHRTPGWQDRVKERIRLAYKIAQAAPACEKCGGPMVPKGAGKNGRKWLFWSCADYPECRGSRTGCNGDDPEHLLEVSKCK